MIAPADASKQKNAGLVVAKTIHPKPLPETSIRDSIETIVSANNIRERKTSRAASDDDESTKNGDACKQKNFRVAARIRPLSKTEIKRGTIEIVSCINNQPSKKTAKGEFNNNHIKSSANDKNQSEMVQIQAGGTMKRWFELDAVFDQNSTQNDVYVRSGAQQFVCEDIFQGFNCTILAYGQAGAGKTFSMGAATSVGTAMNKKTEQTMMMLSETDGIIPRCCHDLFQTIQEKCAGNAQVELSYVEIYNEELHDLLVDDADNNHHRHRKPSALKIRERFNGDVYVEGLEKRIVTSLKDIDVIMEEASKRRIHSSAMGMYTLPMDVYTFPSRSHTMLTLRVKGTKTKNQLFESKLTLVDLAGSENTKKIGIKGGSRMKEDISINKSLLVLGKVVGALSSKKKNGPKPPYRDSKLTRLLQDSLGGNSRTLMLACLSPAHCNMDESMTTLRYATAARNIQNVAKRNLTVGDSMFAHQEEDGDDEQTTSTQLKQENELLKQQLEEMQETLKFIKGDNVDGMTMPTVTMSSDELMDESYRSVGTHHNGTIRVLMPENHQELLDDQSRRLEDQSRTINSQTDRIQELEQEVKHFHRISKLSAVEISTLQLQMACLENQVSKMARFEKENATLQEKLEQALEEAATSEKAANRYADLFEKEQRKNKELEIKLQSYLEKEFKRKLI